MSEQDSLKPKNDVERAVGSADRPQHPHFVAKYLGLLLVVALPFIAGYIGYVYSPEKVVEVETVKEVEVEKEVEKLVTVPSQVQCDYQEYSKDFNSLRNSEDEVIFKGAYATTVKTAWDVEAECNQLVLYGSYPQNKYEEIYVNLILKGNSVQQMTEYGNLRLNLPWQDIPDEDKELIASSTRDNPISIKLKHKIPKSTAAPVCHSFFDYVGIVN